MSLLAISLWEPWASAMAMGLKTIETRSWPTYFRGDLAICASRREMDATAIEVAGQLKITPQPGMCVCVVEVVGCVPTVERTVNEIGIFPDMSVVEFALGNYTPGRFAWLTKNLRKLHTPVPIVGHQGLWTLNPVLESFILKSCLQPLEGDWKRKAYVTA